jgi:nitrate reductase molybdenum cofactor assembly chaperone NarJ/NarW
MTKTFKVLSALLAYPTAELQAASAELRSVVAEEALVTGETRLALERLIEEVATGDIYDLQEAYTLLFDRTRSLSLHLFEHVHGESRDRGQAMIDLKDLYGKGGLAIGTSELPDFLPLFIEFLSTRPLDEARDLLGQTAHILEALGERLEKRDSAYAAIFHALIALAAARGASKETVDDKDDDADPMDFDALDVAWEDAPVSFGPESAPGCKDGLIARLRAAKRPVTATQPD